MRPEAATVMFLPPDSPSTDWRRSLAESIRDPEVLLERLGLGREWLEPARLSAQLFPLLAPASYVARMQPRDAHDPLLRQVLPLVEETHDRPDFIADPLEESAARRAPGLLQKYPGRALLIATGTCAVHCRYCFRRHYPYGEEPRRLEEWEPALAAIASDASLHEVLLSGGDPLVLSDRRLAELCGRLDAFPHVHRMRIHTRLPIVLPDRVTPSLVELLRSLRMTPIMVVHANHARELVGDCEIALRSLVRSGLTVLNQAVLLAGVNDSVEAQEALCERLVDLGVIPYYLHQLDRVTGTGHFDVPEQRGREIVAELRRRLPGYAVPRYVREVPGVRHKVPLG